MSGEGCRKKGSCWRAWAEPSNVHGTIQRGTQQLSLEDAERFQVYVWIVTDDAIKCRERRHDSDWEDTSRAGRASLDGKYDLVAGQRTYLFVGGIGPRSWDDELNLTNECARRARTMFVFDGFGYTVPVKRCKESRKLTGT